MRKRLVIADFLQRVVHTKSFSADGGGEWAFSGAWARVNQPLLWKSNMTLFIPFNGVRQFVLVQTKFNGQND